jgi:hypothetical protein
LRVSCWERRRGGETLRDSFDRRVFAVVIVALLSHVLISKREGGRIALREILLGDDTITAPRTHITRKEYVAATICFDSDS